MKHLSGLAAACLAATVLASGAPAQTALPEETTESCGRETLIFEIAESVIEKRAEMSGLAARRIGAEAAYLMIHYGEMDNAAALALLRSDALAGNPLIDDIIDTYLLSMGDRSPLADITLTSEGIMPSTLRAMLLLDDGETLFALMRQAVDEPDHTFFKTIAANGSFLVLYTADQPDDVRARIAANARAAGLPIAAAVLAATLPDLSLYEEIVAENRGDRFFMAMATSPGLELHMVTQPFRTEPMSIEGDLSHPLHVEIRQMHLDMFDISRADVLPLPATFMSLYLNITGRQAETAAAARAFLGQVAVGAFDPVRDPEAVWLAQWMLLDLASEGEIDPVFAGAVDWPGTRIRHYAGRMGETMAIIAALDAIDTARTAGEPLTGAAPFAVPPEVWPRWIEASGLVQTGAQGELVAMGEAAVVRGVELLYQEGRVREALELADAGMTVEGAVRFRIDVMKRLDRLCAGHTVYPLGILMTGGVMYRF